MNLEETNDVAAATRDVLAHHLECFGKVDLAGTMADYTDASRFFTPDGLLRGSKAIRRFFAVLFEEFEKPGMPFELLRQEISGDTAYRVDGRDSRQSLRSRHRHLHRAGRKDSDPNFCGEDFAEALTSAFTVSNSQRK